jgi:hypothetical protein
MKNIYKVCIKVKGGVKGKKVPLFDVVVWVV